MTYEALKEFLSSANHIYGHVTKDELASIPVSHWTYTTSEVLYVGTLESVSYLSDREILPV